MSIKISVVVPIYNASEYLQACLDSIVNQTLVDIEIILVNDCSLDEKDEEICLSYLKKDSRIIYISLGANIKQGGARNIGIKIAKAEHIIFVDSDDFIENNYCEILFNNAISNDSDIVFALMHKVSGNQPITPHPSLGFMEKMVVQGKNNIICKHPQPHTKIYKKSLFIDNDIFFPEHIFCQDLAIIPSIIYFAKKISFAKDAIYYYRYRNNSVTRNISKKYIDDVFSAMSVLKSFFLSLKNEDKDKMKQEYYSAFFLHVLQYLPGKISSYDNKNFEANRKHFMEKLNKNVDIKDLCKSLKISKLEIGGKISLSNDSMVMKYL